MATSSAELLAALATGKHVLAEPRNGVHVDSLAYVDSEVGIHARCASLMPQFTKVLAQLDEPGMRQKVDELVQAEMKTFAKRDYLELLPPVPEPSFGGSAALQAEYARVAAAQHAAESGSQVPSTSPAISTDHYTTSVLPEDESDPMAWQAAVDKARVRLEAQSLHAVNLELLGKYGSAAWKGHAQKLEGTATATQAALKRLEKSSNDVNAARRSAQSQKGAALSASKGEWTRAMDSSFQLKIAIAELQGKVDTMRKLAEARGVAVSSGEATQDVDGDVKLS